MKSPMKSPAALLTPGRALTFANVAEGAEGLVVEVGQHGFDDLADVAIVRQPCVEPLLEVAAFRSNRRLAAIPVDDDDLLLLAGRKRQAVGEIAERVAVGLPDLAELEDVPMRDGRCL